MTCELELTHAMCLWVPPYPHCFPTSFAQPLLSGPKLLHVGLTCFKYTAAQLLSMHLSGRLHPILGYWRGWSAPENVFIEARAKGSGQLVAKIAAVKGSQSRAQCRTYFPKHFAEGRHKVALVTHLHIPPQQSKVMP